MAELLCASGVAELTIAEVAADCVDANGVFITVAVVAGAFVNI